MLAATTARGTRKLVMVNPLPWALGDRATGLAGWRPGQPVAKAPLHSTGAASCLPALLLGRILPVCSLVAPTARRITGLGATRGSATDCHRQGEECQRVKRPAGSRRAAADVLPGANDPDAARFLVPCPQAAAEDRPCRKVVFSALPIRRPAGQPRGAVRVLPTHPETAFDPHPDPLPGGEGETGAPSSETVCGLRFASGHRRCRLAARRPREQEGDKRDNGEDCRDEERVAVVAGRVEDPAGDIGTDEASHAVGREQ